MNKSHLFTWSLFMDFQILLLFIQTSSLAQTDKNSTIIYQNIVDDPILTSTSEETVFPVSGKNDKNNISHTPKQISPEEHELRTTCNESEDEGNCTTEIYEDNNESKRNDDGEKMSTTITEEPLDIIENEENRSMNLQRIEEYDENATYLKGQNVISSIILSPSRLKYRGNMKELSPIVYDKNRSNNSTIVANSGHRMNSLDYSFVSSIWKLLYKPLFEFVAALTKPLHLSDKPQSVSTSKSETENVTLARISLHNYTRITTINTSIANDPDSQSSQSIRRKLFIPTSPATKLLSPHLLNVSEAIEDNTGTSEPIAILSNPVKSQSKNDHSILEIDTSFSPTMKAKPNVNAQPVFHQNIRDELIQNLFNAENNSLNDNAAVGFMKFMIEKYNNSGIRRPFFSSRHSKIHNVALNISPKIKRAISSTNEYNSADRQELASYFYNGQKLRESYLNHAKLSNQDNLPLNIHNTDQVHDRPNFESYPIQKVYKQNQDSLPREFPGENSKYESNIGHNFANDFNDSSSLYLVDRLGYSILNNAELKSTSTELSIEYDTIYSKYKWADIRSEDLQKKELNTRRNPENITERELQSDSSKRKKSKARRITKARDKKVKTTMKSLRKKSNRKYSRNSPKYSRMRSKYKQRNHEKYIKKNRKRGSLRRKNRRKMSKKNNTRSKQSIKSR